jgi:thioredoxin 1
MVFKEQVILYSQPGALPPEMFEDLVGQVKNIDMEEVRAQMAQHEADHGSEDHDHDHDHAHDHDEAGVTNN